MPLSCDDAAWGLESAERATYVVLDDGSYAQRVIEVEGGEELDCDNIVSTSTLRFGSLVQYEPGKWAKQVVNVGFSPGPSMIVADAGTSEVNGTYANVPYVSSYGVFSPEPDYPVYAFGAYRIIHMFNWQIVNLTTSYYDAAVGPILPSDVPAWFAVSGDDPTPTVTEDA